MPAYSLRDTRLLTISLLFLISLFPLYSAIKHSNFLNDDTYITLTYAKNLARSDGFLFNHPPATLGTTTPLLTLLVGGLGFVLHQTDVALIAVFLSAACWIGIIWCFWFFRKIWGLADYQTVILGLVIAGTGWIEFLGMEAYLFAFLLVLSLSLFLSAHYFLTGLVTGMLFLTRGEGVLVFVIILITLIVRSWRDGELFHVITVRKFLMIFLGFGIPVILWSIYALFVFGSVLPNTLAAKQAQGVNGLGHPFLERLRSEWIPYWGKQFGFERFPVFNFWWLTVVVGMGEAVGNRRQWLLFLIWIFFYITGYAIIGISAYWWYQLPILFVAQLFFALGLIKYIELSRRLIKSEKVWISLSIFIIGLSIFWLAKPVMKTAAFYQGDARGPSYTILADWFMKNTDPSESVASIEIGYLGYYTDNQIIDLAGLILPDIVPHVAEKDFAWGFWHYQPDYYVYLPDFDWALSDIRSNPRFSQEYQSIATLPGPRETDFVIYKRTMNSRQ